MFRIQGWVFFSSLLCWAAAGAIFCAQLSTGPKLNQGLKYLQWILFVLGWAGLLGYGLYRSDLLLVLGLIFFLLIMGSHALRRDRE